MALLALSGVATSLTLTSCAPPAPSVPPVPSAPPLSRNQELTRQTAACLPTKGWPVTISPDGLSVEVAVPADQATRYESDAAAWRALHPNDPPLRDWSDQQWRDWYNAEAATADCLRRHQVSGPQPPSFQKFKEGHLAGNGWVAWSAFDARRGQAAHDALAKACPQPER